MSDLFDVATLSNDEFPLAFPLIQATWPGVDLSSWREFAAFFNGRSAVEGGAGLLVMRDPVGSVCGVLAYRLDYDLQLGRILAVPLFTAVDPGNSMRATQTLLAAAERRAHDLGCTDLQIHLYNEQPGLDSRLRVIGLTFHARLLLRHHGSPLGRHWPHRRIHGAAG